MPDKKYKKVSYNASLLIPKVATPQRTEIPAPNSKLQELIGDPDQAALSTFAQFAPVDPDADLTQLTPSQGDDIFLTYMVPGSRFQDKLGKWWEIEEYDFEGKVHITNVWYPAESFVVSIQDVRRTIYSWVHPIQQIIPPSPKGVDYSIVDVRVVE